MSSVRKQDGRIGNGAQGAVPAVTRGAAVEGAARGSRTAPLQGGESAKASTLAAAAAEERRRIENKKKNHARDLRRAQAKAEHESGRAAPSSAATFNSAPVRSGGGKAPVRSPGGGANNPVAASQAASPARIAVPAAALESLGKTPAAPLRSSAGRGGASKVAPRSRAARRAASAKSAGSRKLPVEQRAESEASSFGHPSWSRKRVKAQHPAEQEPVAAAKPAAAASMDAAKPRARNVGVQRSPDMAGIGVEAHRVSGRTLVAANEDVDHQRVARAGLPVREKAARDSLVPPPVVAAGAGQAQPVVRPVVGAIESVDGHGSFVTYRDAVNMISVDVPRNMSSTVERTLRAFVPVGRSRRGSVAPTPELSALHAALMQQGEVETDLLVMRPTMVRVDVAHPDTLAAADGRNTRQAFAYEIRFKSDDRVIGHIFANSSGKFTVVSPGLQHNKSDHVSLVAATTRLQVLAHHYLDRFPVGAMSVLETESGEALHVG